MKKNIIPIITVILLASCVIFIPIRGSGADARVPALLYHNLTPEDDGLNELVNITPVMFREHMEALKDAGYKTVTLDEYYAYAAGSGTLPPKPVIITFDDGYASNYSYAYPVLRRLDMKATIFIVTDTVGAQRGVSYPHFTWIQAKEMQNSGVIDIQSHSHTHRDMTALSPAEVIRELRLSRYLIEKNLNKKCLYFAYPFGLYDDDHLDLAAEAGYLMQLRIGAGGYNAKDMPADRLNRITAPGNINGQELLLLIDDNISF